VAVGTNPWTTVPPEKLVNLAVICERYGEAAMRAVGAISFPPDKGDLAREAAAEIVAELRAAKPGKAVKTSQVPAVRARRRAVPRAFRA